VSVVGALASGIDGSGLRPFPAQEGDGIRVFGLGDGVAFSDGFAGFLPLTRRQGLGVIIDGPEVETGTEAREVACIGRRVSPFALKKRKAEDESIARKGCVHVEVTEKDLLRAGAGFLGKRSRLARCSAFDLKLRPRSGRHLASSLKSAADALGDQGNDDQHCYDQSSEREQEEAEELSEQERIPFKLAWLPWYPAEDVGNRCRSGKKGKT